MSQQKRKPNVVACAAYCSKKWVFIYWKLDFKVLLFKTVISQKLGYMVC